jgi:hypothetical protein
MAGKNTPEQPGTEVAPIQDVVGTLVAREGDVLGKYLAHEEEKTELDASASYAAIIAEIMGSESIADVLNLPEPTHLSEWVDTVIEIGGWVHRESDFDAGPPVYFTVIGTNLTTGERVLINTSEQPVMAQLLRLRQLDAFPCRVIVRASTRPNKYGKHMHRLVGAGKSNG